MNYINRRISGITILPPTAMQQRIMNEIENMILIVQVIIV
jgi:hypothetical protein